MGSRTRVATLTSLILVALSSSVRADEAAPLDLATLPVELRSTLPPALTVKMPTGQNVTIGSLVAAHTARLARLKAFVLPSPPPLSSREEIGSNFAYLGGGNASVPEPPTPAAVPAKHSHLELVTTAYTDHGWAASYVSFCSRAQASVCLYEPGRAVLTLNYPATGLMSELDPFFNDGDCAAAGGIEVDGYCTFIFPMSATVKFDPGVPPVAQKEGSCPADFVGKIEPKGIVTTAYDPKSYESDENENVEFAAVRSCVIRLYQPVQPKKRALTPRRPGT